MTQREPPRIARWLLLCGYCGAYRDCLDADLLEEYRRGRSRTWYWRETGLALWLSWTSRLREHSLSVLDAALAAFAVIALGLGTLTWAGAEKHAQPRLTQPCAPTNSAAAQQCSPRTGGLR